jgi:aminopeptidase N
MEHHPFWHVARAALADESVLIHEASHGWFGDGIRLRCWEDFTLSEGTVSYLEAHVYGAVAGAAAEQSVWTGYAQELAALTPQVVWPDSCGQVDVLTIFNQGPYVRGAYFYKAVADHIGADVLDQVFRAFYQRWHGRAAGMSDMLTEIRNVSGWDATACADKWLREATVPTQPGCP